MKNSIPRIFRLAAMMAVVTFFTSVAALAGSRPPVLDLSEISALHVEVSDAGGADCPPDGSIETVTAVGILRGGSPGCKYRLRIDVAGNTEQHNAGYDYTYLNGEALYGSDGLGSCGMTDKSATRVVEIASGEAVTLTYDTIGFRYHTDAHSRVTNVVELKSCAGSSCTMGSGHVGVGSVDVSLNMGAVEYDVAAGDLWINERIPSLDLATPKCLHYDIGIDEVDVVTTNAILRQVKTPQGLADVVTNSAFSYDVRFYYASGVGAKTNGLYPITGSPFTVWRFENPDATTNLFNRFWVSEIVGVATNLNKYTWDSTNSLWELRQGSGAEENVETMEEETQVINGYTNTIFTHVIKNASNVVVFKEVETSTQYPWGAEITETVTDPDGAALTNRWIYEDDSNDSDYGRMIAVIKANGYWETYEYGAFGMLTKIKAQYLDAPFDTDDSVCRVTQIAYQHSVYGGFDEKQTLETLMGQEIARNYEVNYWNSRIENITMTVPGETWTSTNKLVTTKVQNSAGDVLSMKRPDGTMSLYEYAVCSTTKTTTVSEGAPNGAGTAITNGTRTVTTVDQAGNLVSERRYAIPQTNVLLYSAVVTESDDLGRPTRIEYNDGTYETKSYSCCGLESWRDREGIYTTYNYNQRKLVSSETRAGVTLLYTYDAHGQRTKTERQAGGGAAQTISADAYDVAGRRTNSTDALGNATAYTETKDASGKIVRTARYPDNSRRVETYYPDGNMLSVTGTAVHPMQYSYGVENNSAFITEVKVGDGGSTSEWVRSWFDMAGRKSWVQYSGGSEERFQYNSKGQVVKQTDRDGGATLFLYNANGEPEYTVVDINTNGAVDYTGLDRIARTVREVTTAHATNVLRVSASIWPSNNVNTSRLAIVQDTSTDGLESWIVAYGLTNYQKTVFNGSGGKTVTAKAPNGSFSVSAYSTGRLMSVSRYTATSQQVSGVTFGYDVYGRQVAITDARSGTTSNAYDIADRLTSVTTPPPTNGASRQTSAYAYDSMGRVTATTLPDGGVVTNQYFDTGELKQTSGARTYPVAYTYDSQGRMKTLTTWKNFAGGSGQAVTTWQYDPQSGYMKAKVYADNSTNAYTYSAGGKVKTRIWARGIVTTYGYNAAGDLLTVGYSDGTPGVTNTFDRLGRVVSVSDASGTRNLTYTVDGQPVSESYASGILASCSVNRQYDAYARLYKLSAVAATTSTVQYGYDGASRMLTVQSGGNTVTYSYHPNSGLVSNMVFNNGTSNILLTTKQYDNLNRLASINHAPATNAAIGFAYIYNSANQRTRCNLSGREYWLYTYDALGQLKSAIKYWSNGVAVAGQSFKSSYDDIGNRKATTNNGRTATYTANTLNQYTQRTVPAYADIIGAAHSQAVVTVNNLSVTRQEGGYFHKALTVSNTVSAAYQGISVVGVRPNAGSNGNDVVTTDTGAVFLAKTPEAFTYDADGNLLTDGRWTNTWDGEGRLVRMETLAGLSSNVPRRRIEFVYDSMGRRMKKTVYSGYVAGYYSATNRTFHLWDGWLPIADMGAGFTNFMTWGLDLSGTRQGAGGVGGLVAISLNGTKCIPAFDGNGNVMNLIISANGSVAATYEYTPWGELIRATGPQDKSNHFRFSTKWQDDETGLLYYGYRWYSPGLGRWPSRDPIGEEGGINLQGFVDNEPISESDQFGLASTCECYLQTVINTETLPMFVYLTSKGCLAGILCGKCEGASGSFNIQTRMICINEDRSSEDRPWDLVHELQHAYDTCEKKCFESCAECMKSEAKAQFCSGAQAFDGIAAGRSCYAEGQNKDCDGKQLCSEGNWQQRIVEAGQYFNSLKKKDCLLNIEFPPVGPGT